MNAKFTFKHLESTDAIKNYAIQRIEKIDKYSLHKTPKCHFIFSVEKNDHIAEVNVDTGGAHFTALATDGNLYTAIDKVVDKLVHQMSKHKGKVQDHHHTPASEAFVQDDEEDLQQTKKRNK